MTDFHAFQMGGSNFLFFPCSARLYELSPEAARLLRELSSRPGRLTSFTAAPEPSAGLSPDAAVDRELRELFRSEQRVSSPAPLLPEERPGRNSLRCFSIYLAQNCNLSCSYCWNRGGSFGKIAQLMELKTAELTVDLIRALLERSDADTVSINFYGGEPLLNFPALVRMTEKLRRQESELGKRFRFCIDTNGVLLAGEVSQFLAGNFAEIGVSLDGGQEVHDLQRAGKHGEPSWLTIADNVRSFPRPELLALRATLTTLSDSYLDTFGELSTLGVRRIQLEYCHDPGYRRNSSYRRLIVPLERQLAELREFIDVYVDAISYYNGISAIPFVGDLIDKISRLRGGNRFARPCGAGVDTLAINSKGEIFPCLAFADREEFTMGMVGTGTALSLPPKLHSRNRGSCADCWLRYDCAGGCCSTHYHTTGDLGKPHSDYCRSMRAKTELYLYAMAQMLKRCPWHLDKSQRSEMNGGDVVENSPEMAGTAGEHEDVPDRMVER